IENLRVAIDELASMAIEAADGGALEITFRSGENELRIEGCAPAKSGAEVGIDALTGQILKAVIDDYELRTDSGHVCFTCIARRSVSGQGALRAGTRRMACEVRRVPPYRRSQAPQRADRGAQVARVASRASLRQPRRTLRRPVAGRVPRH